MMPCAAATDPWTVVLVLVLAAAFLRWGLR